MQVRAESDTRFHDMVKLTVRALDGSGTTTTTIAWVHLMQLVADTAAKQRAGASPAEREFFCCHECCCMGSFRLSCCSCQQLFAGGQDSATLTLALRNWPRGDAHTQTESCPLCHALTHMCCLLNCTNTHSLASPCVPAVGASVSDVAINVKAGQLMPMHMPPTSPDLTASATFKLGVVERAEVVQAHGKFIPAVEHPWIWADGIVQPM